MTFTLHGLPLRAMPPFSFANAAMKSGPAFHARPQALAPPDMGPAVPILTSQPWANADGLAALAATSPAKANHRRNGCGNEIMVSPVEFISRRPGRNRT